MTAHRALPLVEVERRAREARKPWPHACTNGCHTGVCDCTPVESARQWSEVYEPPKPRRPAPPPVPWRELGAGLLVLLFALSCVHVIATATQPSQKVASK